MDLSINKIKQNKTINFKGVKGDLDAKNTQVFRFSTPSYKIDETPQLEITFLKRKLNDQNQSIANEYIPTEVLTLEFDNKNTIEIPQDFLKEENIDAFAYRYIFTDKNNNTREALDAFKTIKINGEKRNIIEIGSNYGVTPQGGTMYHVFVDSVGYNPENIDEKTKNFIRTHANKLGGSIKGLTYLVKNGYYDSYKYIISNPDIGADPTSAHRYWPNNQYQCSNMDDFKDLNFELFKRGKGYVADGAFTSQSLQSPMVQHALKWGKQSPFYYMLKLDEKVQIGVLPENHEAIKNVGIRLINSPLSDDYNKNKPTLMQFVDDRLLDESQRKDTKTPIDKYGKSNPDDHYDSVGYQDTIHPFYFEIEESEFDNKLKVFKNSNYIMLKDLTDDEKDTLFGFIGGDITSRYLAANATFWDGNVDIIKMNLSNPNVSDYKEFAGFEAARDYLLGVATFWSEAVQSDLLKRSVKLSENEISKIAKNGGLTSEEYEVIKQNAQDGNIDSLVIKQNKTVQDYVNEFPLQSIETSPELSAIFSEPEFKNELFKGDIDKKLIQYVDNVIENAIPEQYKQNEEYKTYATKIYANEILKTIYSQAILKDSVDTEGNVNISALRDNATLKSLLSYTPTTVENERNQVVSKIRTNILSVNNDAITEKIKKELKDVSIKDFRLAESVIIQTKSGLNWRFDAAKDIGDLAATRSYNQTITFEDVWNGTSKAPGVQQFWGEFIDRIKKCNPSSYIIAEVTNFGDSLDWMSYDSMMNYDKRLANSFFTRLGNEILKTEPDSKLAEYTRIYANLSLPDEQRKAAWEKANAILKFTPYGNRYETFKNQNNKILNEYFDLMMKTDKEAANTVLIQLGKEILKTEPDSELGKLTRKYMDLVLPRSERKKAWQRAYEILNKQEYGSRYEAIKYYENNLPWAKEQHFLEQIGATTSSNYDKYFNRISAFVGVDPEDGGSGVKDYNAGKLGYLKENTERLLAFDQPNTAILSHTFVDNHDKPRVLHTLPLDMDLVVGGLNLNAKGRYLSSLADLGMDRIGGGDSSETIIKKKEKRREELTKKFRIEMITGRKDLQNVNPMAAAVGLMMYDKINKSSFNNEEKLKLKMSLRKLVNGEKDGKYDSRRARAFGFLPYEITIRDLFKGAEINDEAKIEEFNKLVMDEPMYLEDKIWQLLNALVGVPTLYYGTEYAQTGYETYSKNDLVGNRNRALHERKTDGIYAKFYDKMNATASMANNVQLSALRNGFPESLELVHSNDLELYPIYRKDDRNSQVITVISNFGIKQGVFSKDQGYKFSEKLAPKEVQSIPIKNKTGYCPLDENTKLKRMIYNPIEKKYVAENIEYVVRDGSIVRADGKQIQIDDTVATFYMDNSYKSRYTPSYNGAH